MVYIIIYTVYKITNYTINYCWKDVIWLVILVYCVNIYIYIYISLSYIYMYIYIYVAMIYRYDSDHDMYIYIYIHTYYIYTYIHIYVAIYDSSRFSYIIHPTSETAMASPIFCASRPSCCTNFSRIFATSSSTASHASKTLGRDGMTNLWESFPIKT